MDRRVNSAIKYLQVKLSAKRKSKTRQLLTAQVTVAAFWLCGRTGHAYFRQRGPIPKFR